jgi:hypothetical protein
MLAGAGFNDILDLGVGQPLAFGVVAPLGYGKQFKQEFFLHGGLDIQLGPIVEDCYLGFGQLPGIASVGLDGMVALNE